MLARQWVAVGTGDELKLRQIEQELTEVEARLVRCSVSNTCPPLKFRFAKKIRRDTARTRVKNNEGLLGEGAMQDINDFVALCNCALHDIAQALPSAAWFTAQDPAPLHVSAASH